MVDVSNALITDQMSILANININININKVIKINVKVLGILGKNRFSFINYFSSISYSSSEV